MVHALHEAWRVLVPGGTMIDLRPIVSDGPLDIVYEDHTIAIGKVDYSPGLEVEIASDSAIDSVLSEGIYKLISDDRFDDAYYWQTVRGMLADFREYWKEDLIITDSTIQTAYKLFRKLRKHKQVRLRCPMKLVSYLKQ